MKRLFVGSVTAAALAASLGVSAMGSPAQDTRPDSRLGPMAEQIHNRIGIWNVEMTFRPAPDAPAITSHLVRETRLDGTWLISEFRGTVAGRPFTGLGINGFDPARGKYAGVWVDSMSPAVIPVEGTYDRTSGEFVTSSNEVSPRGAQPVHSTTRSLDRDTEETVLEARTPDGRTFTRMTMRAVRQK